jgi:hypothetical protein
LIGFLSPAVSIVSFKDASNVPPERTGFHSHHQTKKAFREKRTLNEMAKIPKSD